MIRKWIASVLLAASCSLSATNQTEWMMPSGVELAQLQRQEFGRVLSAAVTGEAREQFDSVSKALRNNIVWQSSNGFNRYRQAHQRSVPWLQGHLRDDMPLFVYLVAYLESGWSQFAGDPAGDYGYWQMMPEVVAEIRTLPEASDALSQASLDQIRTDANLSTEAAFIHLHRYRFYFQHVAGFPEEQAWLFTLVAFNWGAGNVKRMLAKIPEEQRSFSGFYLALLDTSKRHPGDRSMQAAVEYVPNLWNVSEVIQGEQLIGSSE